MAKAISSPLELVLDCANDEAVAAARKLQPPLLSRVIALPSDVLVSGPSDVRGVRDRLGRQELTVGGGSRIGFVGISSYGFDPAESDVVWWETDPQLHDCDNHTVMENCLGPSETILAGRVLAPGRALSVAIGLGPGDGSDSRLRTAFGACWLVGAASGLAAAGADAASWFQAIGPAGVLQSGQPTPTFTVLRELRRLSDGQPLQVESTARSRFFGMAAELPTEIRGLLANLSPDTETIEIRMPRPGHCRWTTLSGRRWRSRPSSNGDRTQLEVAPYEILRFAITTRQQRHPDGGDS
jgi:hypothetical protein